MQNPYLHRFSLRALLGLLLFVCVVLGIVASRACRQRHAVEIVTSMGGSADYDYQWWRSWRDDTWVDLSLSFPRPVPWIANLLGVDFIAPVTSVSLDLDNEYLGRLEVQRVLELPSLSRLSLMKGHLSSKTLSQIARLSRLRILDLTDTDLTDDGLKKLSCNGLECLDISGTDVGDKGLSHLAALPDLYALYLRDTRITDAGLEQISGQPQISQLDLSATNITDEGLSQLRALPELDWLVIDQALLTAAGVRHLRRLSKLTHLWVCGPGPSSAPLADLPSLRFLGLAQTAKIDVAGNRLPNVSTIQIGSPRNEALNGLQGFPGLVTLNIIKTPVDDEQVAMLCQLRRLARLTMIETGLSKTGEASIRRALPSCSIRVDP